MEAISRPRVIHQIHPSRLKKSQVQIHNAAFLNTSGIEWPATSMHQKSGLGVQIQNVEFGLPAVGLQSINSQSSDVAQNWKKILTVQDQLIMHSSLQELLPIHMHAVTHDTPGLLYISGLEYRLLFKRPVLLHRARANTHKRPIFSSVHTQWPFFSIFHIQELYIES